MRNKLFTYDTVIYMKFRLIRFIYHPLERFFRDATLVWLFTEFNVA